MSSAPAPVRRVPVRGPFGRQPLAELIARRVLHEWLHEQDIAAGTIGELARGEETARAGAPAVAPAVSPAVGEIIAQAVLQLLPVDILPRAALDRGVVRLVVDLGGSSPPRPRECAWGLDFRRRQYGPRVVATPDAQIRLEVSTLALVVHGRSDRLGAAPCVQTEGDQALASAVLTALGAPRAPTPCLGVQHRSRAISSGG